MFLKQPVRPIHNTQLQRGLTYQRRPIQAKSHTKYECSTVSDHMVLWRVVAVSKLLLNPFKQSRYVASTTATDVPISNSITRLLPLFPIVRRRSGSLISFRTDSAIPSTSCGSCK